MASITVDSFNRICRTCLCKLEQDTAFNINNFMRRYHESEQEKDEIAVATVLSKYTSVKINTEDSLPKNICQQCMSDLIRTYKFVNNCQKSDEILQAVLARSNTNIVITEEESNMSTEDDTENIIVEFKTENNTVEIKTENNIVDIPEYGENKINVEECDLSVIETVNIKIEETAVEENCDLNPLAKENNKTFYDQCVDITDFLKCSYEEKIKIKKEGRPLPDITIKQGSSSRGKAYNRQFNRNVYAKNNWICGCNKKNALFCFPCLLFGGDKSWTKNGVTDLIHLSDKIKKHEISKHHMHNQVELAVLGSVNIKQQFDSAFWANIHKFNENVTKNRYVLSKIIDCIKFCGVFELAFREHDEREKSDNSGIFRGLINFSSELDKTLAEHLEKSAVFKEFSKEIQNDLLNCMLEVCQEAIFSEIREAPYAAILCTDTTDVSADSQFVVVFRYCRKGEPVERFWTYLQPTKLNSDSLTRDIFNILDPILEKSNNKLIAQSYDGTTVMSGRQTGVQAKVKLKYPFANFMHCYAHQLNSIIANASSQNSQVRLFFGNLQEIPAFFKNSPQRVALLEKIVQKRIPHDVPNEWNFNIRTVNLVFEHRESLIECMEEIEESVNNQTVCSAASCIRRILIDPNFVFWLTFFHRIMPHVDVLFNELQKRQKDPTQIDKQISVFEQNIVAVRNTLEEIVQEATNLYAAPLPAKRRRQEVDYRRVATEICNVIINCVKDRFEFKAHGIAASLFYPELFSGYCRKLPEEKINSICSAYPNLDKERLKTELSVIYYRTDCRNIRGVMPFLKFLIENNLGEVFSEIKKLLEILITVPMSTPETERCLSTLKRVKTFLKYSMIEDHLVALSMLSIEKNLVSEIPNFNELVIDKFSSKENRKIDLIYKK